MVPAICYLIFFLASLPASVTTRTLHLRSVLISFNGVGWISGGHQFFHNHDIPNKDRANELFDGDKDWRGSQQNLSSFCIIAQDENQKTSFGSFQVKRFHYSFLPTKHHHCHSTLIRAIHEEKNWLSLGHCCPPFVASLYSPLGFF